DRRVSGDTDEAQQYHQDRATDHGHIGHVEDRPVGQLEEVDHLTAERAGGRSSRSWMFPSAPPRIRDIAIAYQVERTALTVKTTTPITMPSCRTVTAGVMPDPIPQAAPE